MLLSSAQIRHFIDNGFVVIRNVVSNKYINEALHIINHGIGEGLESNAIPSLEGNGRYFPHLTSSPAITNLANATPVHSLAEAIVGNNRLPPLGYGQIALRFPVFLDEPPKLIWHLDGKWGINSNVPKDELGANFTILACVLASDVSSQFAGNFTVWPKTHLIFAEHFRKHGPYAFLENKRDICLPDPIQIMGSAGDIILSHYLLAHCAAPNLSHNIRYAMFFRLKNYSRDDYKLQTLTDAWIDFPHINDILAD